MSNSVKESTSKQATNPVPSDSFSYEDLYKRWEHGHWRATEIDFSEDKEVWNSLSPVQRKSAIWMYSMFFYGEDSVAENLSPYIDAAPTPEQKYFLATQQADEVRHAVFFHRFFKEVIEAGDTPSDTLSYAEPQLGWAYKKVFNRLDQMSSQLRRDPSLPQYAQAIALYHMIVEGSLAQPGQHFIEDYFSAPGEHHLPGFSAGMERVSHDEQRHIGFGVKALAELFRQSDECKASVEEILMEMFPYTAAVFTPPQMDESYNTAYDFTLEEIYAFALRLVETRWKATGFPLEEMSAGVYPLNTYLPYDVRAHKHVDLLRAGFFQEPGSATALIPGAQDYYFEIMSNCLQLDKLPITDLKVQFEFSDLEPWYLKVGPYTKESKPGTLPGTDLLIQTDWDSWVRLTRGENPLPMLRDRRLHIEGWKALYQLNRAVPAGRRWWPEFSARKLKRTLTKL